MKAIALAVALLGLAVLAGCPHHHLRHRHHGPVVLVPSGHVHSHHCGHYHHNGGWYHSHGHVHGHGCGHILRGGIWVFVD